MKAFLTVAEAGVERAIHMVFTVALKFTIEFYT